MSFKNILTIEKSNLFNISYKHRTIYVKYYSELNKTDLVISSSQLVGDIRFDDAHYLAWDFSEVTQMVHDEHSASLLTSITQRLKKCNKEIKIAYITDNTDLRNMINKHLDLSNSLDIDIRLFSSINEFIIWSSKQHCK